MPAKKPNREFMVDGIIEELRGLGNAAYRERMAKFGINPEDAIGVPVPDIRKEAKKIPSSADISRKLWSTGIHEAMILATMTFPPEEMTEEIAAEMIRDVPSWDICDHFTGNLVANSEHSLILKLIDEWANDPEEYVRRAAFSLIASVDHSSMYNHGNVMHFLTLIVKASDDNRNFVKKAVNWALREIGKSSEANRLLALEAADNIIMNGTTAGRWIGSNAKRELGSRKVIDRLSVKG